MEGEAGVGHYATLSVTEVTQPLRLCHFSGTALTHLIYPFVLKCPSASSVLRNTFVAVSVMNGDGIPRHAQTT